MKQNYILIHSYYKYDPPRTEYFETEEQLLKAINQYAKDNRKNTDFKIHLVAKIKELKLEKITNVTEYIINTD